VGKEDSYIVTDCQDWKSGDKIIVSTMGMNVNQTEIVTINYVEPRYNNKSRDYVALKEKFKYDHSVGTETYGSTDIELRTEVALLSRNVVIRGDDTSTKNKYGATISVHPEGDDSTVCRLSGIELADAGQAKHGRFPIHFNELGLFH